MNQQRLFSIFFSSFWLMIYYHDRLAKNRNDSGGLKLFLDAFWNGPRLWTITSIKHHAGYCYTVDLGRDFLSDKHGASVLLLAEDGTALPMAHTRKTQEIVDQGGGRYFHAHRTLYFSPHDNADTATVLKRKYLVIERVVDNQEMNTALGRLNDKRDTFSNVVLFGFEKLKIYFGKKLKFGGLADIGKAALGLRHLVVDLAPWHFGQWQFEKLDVHAENNSNGWIISANFSEAKSDMTTATASGHLEVMLDNNGVLLPLRIKIDIDGNNWLDSVCEWSNAKLERARMHFNNIVSLRANLRHGVGGDDNDYRRWLTEFLGSWASKRLELSCTLTDSVASQIIVALDPASTQEKLTLSLQRDGDHLRLETGEKSTTARKETA